MEESMGLIDIQNTSNEPLHYSLPHQEVCVKVGRCICDKKTGACASLHILAHQRARGIDQAVLFAKKLRDAVDAQDKLIVYPSKHSFAAPVQAVEVPKQVQNNTAGSRKSARKKGNTLKE